MGNDGDGCAPLAVHQLAISVGVVPEADVAPSEDEEETSALLYNMQKMRCAAILSSRRRGRSEGGQPPARPPQGP
eukprot:7482559-Alexandrium_andersonii.AAC.1